MSPGGLAVACFIAAFGAFAVSLMLVRNGHRHQVSLDTTWSGPQKIHQTPVPRVGGLAIAAGLLAAAAAATVIRGSATLAWLLLACVAPGFLWGFIEDISKKGAVFARLSITGCSAMLAFVLMDARITELGVPVLDSLLMLPMFSFAFTVFAVAGVGHAMNVIDGLNGLSGVTALLGSLGLAVVAWLVGDSYVLAAASALGASVLGFLFFNFPRGRIFLGDGGAYLIGLVLAELSVLLVHRNPQVSPWFPLVLLAYPIWETLFSMYRRRMRRVSAGRADALHLHSLVYRRMVRPARPGRFAHSRARNSLASLVLWILPMACCLAAVLLWDSTPLLQGAAFAFAAGYVFIYRRIVRFRLPTRLVVYYAPYAKARFARPIVTESK